MLIRIRNTCCRHTLHVPGSSLSFTCHLYPSCVIPPSMCRPFVHALSHFRHFPRVAHPSTGTCRPFFPRVVPSLQVQKPDNRLFSRKVLQIATVIARLSYANHVSHQPTHPVPCYWFDVQESSYMILDCGEGSLSQLFRLHGADRAQQILRDLKAVYVSHQHADHHLGTVGSQLIHTTDYVPVPYYV